MIKNIRLDLYTEDSKVFCLEVECRELELGHSVILNSDLLFRIEVQWRYSALQD